MTSSSLTVSPTHFCHATLSRSGDTDSERDVVDTDPSRKVTVISPRWSVSRRSPCLRAPEPLCPPLVPTRTSPRATAPPRPATLLRRPCDGPPLGPAHRGAPAR